MTDEATTPAVETPTTPTAEPAPAVETTVLDTAKPAEEAPKAEEKPAATPFDAEKFEAPEGLELSPEDKTQLSDLATKHGLTSEAMSDLLTTYRDRIKEASGAAEKAFEQVNAKWVEEVKKDPTIGGDKLPETLSTIAKVLDNPAFADPEFKRVMAYTGAGNNPAVVRTLFKMAQALTEGGHVSGEPAKADAKPAPGPSALYPNLPRS